MTKQELFKTTDKLSVLLKIALDDLENIEKDDNYIVRMRGWHMPSNKIEDHNACYVCMAGSVMAKTFGKGINTPSHPDDTSQWNFNEKCRFWIINDMRIGYLPSALLGIRGTKEGIKTEDRAEDWEIDVLCNIKETGNFFPYEDFSNFKKSMKFYREIQFTLEWLGF